MLIVSLLAAALAQSPTTPKWQMVFHDEFDGPPGAPPSPDIWIHETGGNGFGNRELESYTDSTKNAYLDGRGHLVIEARRERTVGPDGIARDYSSARLLTRGHFEQKYGRFEARIQVPQGQGIWPAFWMLGDDIKTAGWPRCGEIDIMECINAHPKACHGTLHGPGYSGANGPTSQYLSSAPLSDGFHVYAVEWGREYVKWFVDGNLYHTVQAQDVAPNDWVFDHPFFLLLNLAVGGQWPGYPDATTVFPQKMVVDYIRVYRQVP